MPGDLQSATTLFDKIWRQHVVLERDDGQTLLYIDRHYVGDDLPIDTFRSLHRRGIPIRRADTIVASPDHYAPTAGARMEDVVDDQRRAMILELRQQSERAGFTYFGLGDARQGIVHVVGPEQGLTLPGMTVVCGDSHTATHGALGTFALGIGATEVAHVLATQTLWQRKPATMRVRLDGTAPFGVTAKDIIMAVIRQIGAAGAAGHVIEYQGSAVQALSMEGRMTLCNMSIEAGARAGLVAPDEVALDYLRGRPGTPVGAQWDELVARCRTLRSDADAVFDREVTLDVSGLAPMVTWGTSPAQAMTIAERIPSRDAIEPGDARLRFDDALRYMDLGPGLALAGLPVDRVFIGSCTNGRIEDLRLAASLVQGRVARVPALVVPGSGLVRRQAEAEGLDRIFLDAGMQWGQPGCSMCLAINGDAGRPGERCVSTSNRNFVGRQGRGVRTHLVNPGMAAAAAIHGRLVDYRNELPHAAL
ncbi:3-isopropylmalate dehydratase large subunit [Bordetella flabilis]|uniref:3-isopropylmalate dehydratase n=1 Tax=Bordetella flabilis TaxID=463014 RepID=A0A193GCJ5_9BORD|nr:3-isopropylmalate dehydratase large subunit [Bordetella flabilis]ANN77742.1 3-isopropylmalate dehydratase large subunit [Bordetella flabilis]